MVPEGLFGLKPWAGLAPSVWAVTTPVLFLFRGQRMLNTHHILIHTFWKDDSEFEQKYNQLSLRPLKVNLCGYSIYKVSG